MASERQGNTLQGTALVHEVYLRLFEDAQATEWQSRAHFFGAVGEAMRRILVERARAKVSTKTWRRDCRASCRLRRHRFTERFGANRGGARSSRCVGKHRARSSRVSQAAFLCRLHDKRSRRALIYLATQSQPPLGLCQSLAQYELTQE